ncbi:MAG: RnfABCDGE type electron transport complex subunit D [Bacteroidales bacterium]|nr:RnfABCDGE type electron transport complex subunit D [Bacteroidales bacterium]
MNKLIVSPSPHVHGKDNTRRLMGDVIIALLPAVLVSIYFFGLSAIHLVAVSVVACVAVEFLIQKFLLKGKSSIGDLSAIVTGVLLALNLPVCSPWWLILIGAVVAIGIAKMTFGGLGQNIFNPALVARVVLLVSFPILMTGSAFHAPESGYIFGNAPEFVDATSGATPLALVKEQLAKGVAMDEIMKDPNLSYFQMLYARMGGSAGELSAIALILGFVYLLVRRVIKPYISLSVLLTVFIFSGLLYLGNPAKFVDPVFNLLTGGLLLGAFFMATDYVTSPMTTKGQIIFGVGIGVITVLIRAFGAYPEGVSFAILIMNSTVPLLNKIQPKRFAKEAQKK